MHGWTRLAGIIWLAAGGDERLEGKDILKQWSPERQRKKEEVKSAFQLKMVIVWNEIFLAFVKMICSGTEI